MSENGVNLSDSETGRFFKITEKELRKKLEQPLDGAEFFPSWYKISDDEWDEIVRRGREAASVVVRDQTEVDSTSFGSV